MKKIVLILALSLLGTILFACTSQRKATTADPLLKSGKMAVTSYDSNFLWNLKLGREFVAQGRYELAKEHFLYSLASCNDDTSRELVTHELNAVILMIQTQR